MCIRDSLESGFESRKKGKTEKIKLEWMLDEEVLDKIDELKIQEEKLKFSPIVTVNKFLKALQGDILSFGCIWDFLFYSNKSWLCSLLTSITTGRFMFWHKENILYKDEDDQKNSAENREVLKDVLDLHFQALFYAWYDKEPEAIKKDTEEFKNFNILYPILASTLCNTNNDLSNFFDVDALLSNEENPVLEEPYLSIIKNLVQFDTELEEGSSQKIPEDLKKDPIGESIPKLGKNDGKILIKYSEKKGYDVKEFQQDQEINPDEAEGGRILFVTDLITTLDVYKRQAPGRSKGVRFLGWWEGSFGKGMQMWTFHQENKCDE